MQGQFCILKSNRFVHKCDHREILLFTHIWHIYIYAKLELYIIYIYVYVYIYAYSAA